jgi:hypothetical protein
MHVEDSRVPCRADDGGGATAASLCVLTFVSASHTCCTPGAKNCQQAELSAGSSYVMHMLACRALRCEVRVMQQGQWGAHMP